MEFRRVAAFAHESLVDETLGHDDMGKCRQNRDIGARLQRQMIIGLDMRHADQIDAARIENDQFRPFAQPLFHARRENGVPIGRIGADDHDDIGFIDRIEILGSR